MKQILVATDGSAHAEKAISFAADLAAKHRAGLAILHSYLINPTANDLRKLADRKKLGKEMVKVLETYEANAREAMLRSGDGVLQPIFAPRDLVEAVGRQVADRAVAEAKRKGVKRIDTIFDAGDPADNILKQAKKIKADTIVIGSRGLSDLKGFFLGSVSHKVASRSTCTCITVK
jgi:nucleotide-binding universal stress UspA family protein